MPRSRPSESPSPNPWRRSLLARSVSLNDKQETAVVDGGTSPSDMGDEDGTTWDEEGGAWRGEDEVAYLLQKVKQGAKNIQRAEQEKAQRKRREAEEIAAKERALQAEIAAEEEQRRKQEMAEERRRLQMLSNGVRACVRPHTKSQAAEVK